MTYCWSTRLSILVFWFAVVTGLSAMAAYRAYHLLQLLSPTFYWRQVLTHLLFFSLSLARIQIQERKRQGDDMALLIIFKCLAERTVPPVDNSGLDCHRAQVFI